MKLKTKQVETLGPGYHHDGNGLYLQVNKVKGRRSWIFRYMRKGKAREMGLGSFLALNLAEARDEAQKYRRLLKQGFDPIEARADARVADAAAEARRATFAECAADYIATHQADWKNEKHAAQWKNTLTTYCGDIFGSVAVQNVDTPLILKALKPIWTQKPETASRLRARIERVLDWAAAQGFRSGENPARWKGHLDKLLPKLEKRKRVKHHAALPFREMGKFMEAIRSQDGIAARALEFLILTTARTGEVIGARRSEFDLENRMWTVPAARMKAHREHRVPLVKRAVEILDALRFEEREAGDFVFPGTRAGQPLSNMAMLALLERMERDDITVHGFRSSFRDWAAECTSHPRDVCEMALAHTIGDQTEAAYRRGDLLEKRRRLMEDWARHCGSPPA
jgi:integrase